MNIKINTTALLDALTKDNSDKNPFFVSDGNEAYIRYDRISLEGSGSEETLIKFYWKGQEVCVVPVSGVTMSPSGRVLSIDDLDGRMRFRIL